MAGINRNHRPTSVGIGGRLRPESPAGINRNGWPTSIGISGRYRAEYAVKPFGFHAIRHLSASILYNLGYEVAVIQMILRHQNPTTTEGYLKSLGLEKTREALESLTRKKGEVIFFPEEKRKMIG